MQKVHHRNIYIQSIPNFFIPFKDHMVIIHDDYPHKHLNVFTVDTPGPSLF